MASVRSGTSESGSSSSFPSGVELPRAFFDRLVEVCSPRRLVAFVVGTFLWGTRLSLRERADEGDPLLDALLDAFVLADGDLTGVSGTGISWSAAPPGGGDGGG